MNIVSLIKEVASDHDWSVRTDYSGRCMYGRKCVGVVTDDPMQFCLELGIKIGAQGDTSNQPTDIRTDSMGRSTIVYFPDVQCDEEDEEEDYECEDCGNVDCTC